MGTLYVDHRNAVLRAEGGALALYRGEERVRTVPLRLLERVVVVGGTALDSRVLGALARHGVVLALCSARDPQAWGVFAGPAHNDAALRLVQFRIFSDPQRRLPLARWVVHAKLARYRRFHARVLRRRPDARKPLQDAIRALDELLAAVRTAESLERLRGLEGVGARAGFSAYAAIVPPDLGFRQRARRPPPDPVNALLSLTYTLLHARAHQVLHAAGFDPAIGMLHDPAFGRASAAADLTELWRAAADEWVWRLVAERRFRREHFRQDGEACLLAKSARRDYYIRFETWVRPVHRAMRLLVARLARAAREEDGHAA